MPPRRAPAPHWRTPSSTPHRGYALTRPADPAASGAYLAAVRLEDVNAALRAAWSDPSRLIFLTHNRRIAGGEKAVLKAWREAAAR